MHFGELKPSDQIREIFAALGWTCNLSPAATEDDWALWLESFEPPVKLGDCPECGGQLQERNGKYGRFAGCENYPECRHTSELEDARLQTLGVTEADVKAHQERF